MGSYSAIHTNGVFLLLFVVLCGLIRFKGDSFFCRLGTALLGSFLISVILQNLCKMLHRKLNQVVRPATEHLHSVSLQKLFQTSGYLNVTHRSGSEVRPWKLIIPEPLEDLDFL